MKLSDFKVLTFDCYGTLIDWETGIVQSLRPWLKEQGKKLIDEDILHAFALYETQEQQKNPTMLYPYILGKVHKKLAEHWNIISTDEQREAFSHSVQNWPVFADSIAALQQLKKYFYLVILSNIDKQSFAESNKKLEIEFDLILTAEEIGSYKPSKNNFAYMLNTLRAKGFHKEDILHTAQSLYHDHEPAKALKLATCWINRRHDKAGSGATPQTKPISTDFTVTSLQEWVNILERELLLN